MKVGVFLPSFLFAENIQDGAESLRAFARRAEELGFDSLWITDHIVTARRFYSTSWLDAITTLSHVAAITERVQLGTSILILPLRQPAVLAKEIATLHHLSGERFIFGVGTGWYGPEFEACGVHRSERGSRTDEVLACTSSLLRNDDVTYSGRYYQLDGVTVEPHPRRPPLVWVGGGRQLPHVSSPEEARMNPRVLDRIVGSDGWIARPTCPPELISVDAAEIRALRSRLGKSSHPFTMAHENFTWIEETGTEEQIVGEQQRRFSRIVSDERPWDYISAVYLTGSIEQIQKSIQARVDAGISYLMLHTLSFDLHQLELLSKYVLEPFGSAGSNATAGDGGA